MASVFFFEKNILWLLGLFFFGLSNIILSVGCFVFKLRAWAGSCGFVLFTFEKLMVNIYIIEIFDLI